MSKYFLKSRYPKFKIKKLQNKQKKPKLEPTPPSTSAIAVRGTWTHHVQATVKGNWQHVRYLVCRVDVNCGY